METLALVLYSIFLFSKPSSLTERVHIIKNDSLQLHFLRFWESPLVRFSGSYIDHTAALPVLTPANVGIFFL